MSKRWYVVHAYSGFENQVKRSLEERIRRAEMEERFGEVLVPTEEVIEMRWPEAPQRAQVLPRLRAGADRDEYRGQGAADRR